MATEIFNLGEEYQNQEAADFYNSLIKKLEWKDDFCFINKNFKGANGARGFFREPFSKMIYTNGCKEVFDVSRSYWLLGIITSLGSSFYEKHLFVVWNILYKNKEHFVICSDGNNNILVSMKIFYSDFNTYGFEGGEFWVSNGTLLLPEEY